MAVKASSTITIFHVIDIDSVTIYYLLQSSTANPPSKPTTDNPGGNWSTTEPTYTSGSTNTLYTVTKTKYSDGTFEYTPVSKFSSYEAAKEAYNKAQNAQDTANNVSNKLLEKDIIVGTQTATTRFWTGVSQLESLQDGDEIIYWLPYAGKAENGSDDKVTGVAMRVDSSTTKPAGTKINSWENTTTSSANSRVWLNLTLKDGSTKTGWIPCYYGGTTRLTTHYGAGNAIRLVYRVNANIAGVQYTGWFGDANYADGNTNYYDRIRFQNAITAKTAITAETLNVGDSSGFFKLVAGSVFNIDKPILWSGSAINANATGTNNYIMYSAVNLTKNISGLVLTNKETVYLKGDLNGNTFTVDSTTPFTTTKPTTEDGKYYISLGIMYNTTNCGLFPEHPIFKYVNGQFKNISQIAYEAQANLDDFEEDMNVAIISVTNLYYASDSESVPSKPSSHIGTNNVSTYNQWNIALPTHNDNYPYLYTCKEILNKGGTYSWTSVEQTTYNSEILNIKSNIAGIEVDYLKESTFTSYKREQYETETGVKSRLSQTEVTLYGSVVYDLQTAQPSDWSTNYNNYYIKVGNDYIPITDEEAPTWQSNTYYTSRVDYEDPNALTNKVETAGTNASDALDRIGTTEDILEGTGLNEYDSTVKISQRFLDIEDTVDKITRAFNITGGVNLIQNSAALFHNKDKTDYGLWNIHATRWKDSGYVSGLTGLTLSRGQIFCGRGSWTTKTENISNLIPGKVLSVSFKYIHSSNARSVIKIYNGSYELLTAQPSDWSTNYSNYYRKNGDSYFDISATSAPTWQTGTYYRLNGHIYFRKEFNHVSVYPYKEYAYNPNTDADICNPTFVCQDNSLTVEIGSVNTLDEEADHGTDGIAISDLMLNYGEPRPWELHSSEAFNSIFKLSSLGIELTSTAAKTKNYITQSGILVYQYTPPESSDPFLDGTIGDLIAKIDIEGTLTKGLKSTSDIIHQYNYNSNNHDDLINTVIRVGNNNYFVEYIDKN